MREYRIHCSHISNAVISYTHIVYYTLLFYYTLLPSSCLHLCFLRKWNILWKPQRPGKEGCRLGKKIVLCWYNLHCFLSVFKICCSVAKLCLTLCNPLDCSTPGSPVLHYLPEFAQIHVHWVSDTTEPFHPLPRPSPFPFGLSQYQSFPVSWLFASHGQIFLRYFILNL